MLTLQPLPGDPRGPGPRRGEGPAPVFLEGSPGDPKGQADRPREPKRTLSHTDHPTCAAARSHEARLERMSMVQPWCGEIAGLEDALLVGLIHNTSCSSIPQVSRPPLSVTPWLRDSDGLRRPPPRWPAARPGPRAADRGGRVPARGGLTDWMVAGKWGARTYPVQCQGWGGGRTPAGVPAPAHTQPPRREGPGEPEAGPPPLQRAGPRNRDFSHADGPR